jgi:signal transduction histidine kinase
MIFNKFVQATDKIEKIYGGSGLGLSISIKLAELMGGTISLNSVLGVGSEFSLLLELVLA